MAMIDYGSVVKKNGLIVQKEMFMDMQEAVGFTIKELYHEDWGGIRPINGNFFSYMGDKGFLVCVYKGQLVIISNNKVKKIIWDGIDDGTTKLSYKKQALHIEILGIRLDIKRLYDHYRFKLRFWYNGNLYECLYGYGVDVNKDIWYNVKPNEREFIDNWFRDKNLKKEG